MGYMPTSLNLNETAFGPAHIHGGKRCFQSGFENTSWVIGPANAHQHRRFARLIDDGPQVHQIKVDQAHSHQCPDQSVHQIFNPFRTICQSWPFSRA